MKKSKLQSLLLRFIYSGLCRWMLKPFVHIRFEDTRVFERQPQFILIANHSSHMDTIGILSALPSHLLWKVRPVAAEDYFGRSRLRRWLSNFFVNTLTIERIVWKMRHNNPLQKMLRTLDEGYSLIIYPEGTRKNKGTMTAIKSGIAHLLALRPNVGYIPVHLQGMKDIIRLKKGPKRITFGALTHAESTSTQDILQQVKQEYTPEQKA